MSNLSKVLVVKIAMTVLVWCIPLLLFPVSLLQVLGFVVPEPHLFLRLLGMAYVALVVGYAFSLQSSLRGEYPRSGVWVGIVSNGGAFILLLVGAAGAVWASWGVFAQAVMWLSLAGTGAVTAGLTVFGPLARHSTAESKNSPKCSHS